MISPEKEVAEAALQRLSAPSAFDTENFFDDRAQSEWEGGSDEAEADYVLGLLEREEITDSGKLGERVSIPTERAARYITENTARIARRNHDGNT